MREDTRNKSENDWCRKRGFKQIASKQSGVAVGNKVMDTRLPQPAGCGYKYDVSGLGSGLLRCYTPRNDVCYVGRSMIEMLGVLAIIAVLTVGGIAGYSKAMKKYQANKVVGEVIQVLVKLKELSESDDWYSIYILDDETKKTLGLCLPSAENCSGYQRTPVGEININGNVFMIDADAELCISAFNNIVIPLKGNINEFSVGTKIKSDDDAKKGMDECNKKCKDKCKDDRNCLRECWKSETYNTCINNTAKRYTYICISEDKENCSGSKYLHLYDSRVVTEVNAACNSGIDKKASAIRIIFKNGFTGEYLH